VSTYVKSRLVALDGLRGLAAVVVVVWHTGATRFIPGGYLAVDLFFVLSGFVLSHAYEGRGVRWRAFMLSRLIRLYPLYALGTALGAVTILLFVPADGRFWGSLGAAALMLPSPAIWSVYRPFPLDVPVWSLFFELLVNAAWFAVLPRLSTRTLLGILFVAAVGVVVTIALKGSIQVGDAAQDFLPWGIVRTTYSFFAGIGIYRLWRSHSERMRVPLWVAPLAFMAVVAVPIVRALVDGTAVLVLIPAIIFFGACSQASGAKGTIMIAAGATSYATYTLHAPLLTWFNWVLWASVPRLAHPPYWMAAVGTPCIVIGALLVDNYFDNPIRQFLSRTLLSRQTPPQK
jgi:peptidoglycan/LPS O-acetylase OafA/YrhL